MCVKDADILCVCVCVCVCVNFAGSSESESSEEDGEELQTVVYFWQASC